ENFHLRRDIAGNEVSERNAKVFGRQTGRDTASNKACGSVSANKEIRGHLRISRSDPPPSAGRCDLCNAVSYKGNAMSLSFFQEISGESPPRNHSQWLLW